MFGFGDKGLPTMVSELKQLTIDYAKQETIEPLKGLVRYLAWGLAGSLMIAIGLTLWIVAGLRALQEETGTTFTEHLSWAPYAIVLVMTTVVISLAGYAIGRERRASSRREEKRKAREASDVQALTATGGHS